MYQDFIENALKAAKYHEDKAFLMSYLENNEYNKIVWHLRSYFWELWSVWDYILQYTNSTTLKLDPYYVRGNFLKELKKKMPNYNFLSLLETLQNNERLERLMWLRDYAHKWQINPYQIDYDDKGVNVISLNNLDLKDKHLPGQINIDRNDLWFMTKVVDDLIKNGFFN